jgi:hypothetical protein
MEIKPKLAGCCIPCFLSLIRFNAFHPRVVKLMLRTGYMDITKWNIKEITGNGKSAS